MKNGTVERVAKRNKTFRKLCIYMLSVGSVFVSIFAKDRVILMDAKRKTHKNRVNLHWWRPFRKDQKENLGDYLSTVVCEYMLKRKNIDINNFTKQTLHLYAIGSILTYGMQNATIWGSGIKTPDSTISKISLAPILRKLDIRIVRGPKTRDVLIRKGYNCPEKYGDPAVLMPLIYTPAKCAKTKDFIVILHMSSMFSYENSLNIITADYKRFIDEIYCAKKVISSSLHGIILAESYGVPAILLSDKESQHYIFKYDDYYHSTNRFTYPIANSIEEAISMEPAPLPENMRSMQETLIATFPYDMWSE